MTAGTRSPSRAPSPRTALVVMDFWSEQKLCPFFAKCSGVLVIDATNASKEFHRRVRGSEPSVCDLILQSNANGSFVALSPTLKNCGCARRGLMCALAPAYVQLMNSSPDSIVCPQPKMPLPGSTDDTDSGKIRLALRLVTAI